MKRDVLSRSPSHCTATPPPSTRYRKPSPPGLPALLRRPHRCRHRSGGRQDPDRSAIDLRTNRRYFLSEGRRVHRGRAHHPGEDHQCPPRSSRDRVPRPVDPGVFDQSERQARPASQAHDGRCRARRAPPGRDRTWARTAADPARTTAGDAGRHRTRATTQLVTELLDAPALPGPQRRRGGPPPPPPRTSGRPHRRDRGQGDRYPAPGRPEGPAIPRRTTRRPLPLRVPAQCRSRSDTVRPEARRTPVEQIMGSLSPILAAASPVPAPQHTTAEPVVPSARPRLVFRPDRRSAPAQAASIVRTPTVDGSGIGSPCLRKLSMCSGIASRIRRAPRTVPDHARRGTGIESKPHDR